MKIFLLAVVGLLLHCETLRAQQMNLKGKVTDGSTGDGLADVVFTTNDSRTYTSGKDGAFSLPCSPGATFSVVHPGFEPQTILMGNCEKTLDISLLPVLNPLDEVEVTSTRDNKLLLRPVSVVRLRKKELKRGTGLFLDDAINQNVPGVFMERRTISAGQQFNIRGYGNGARGTNGVSSNFDGQGYKVYLNNIPITDAEGITLMDDIDFGSIGNVEVTKGPAGTLYGLAIAGVVHLSTAPAERNKTSIGQELIAGSYGLLRSTTRVSIGGQQSSILLTYGKQLFGGYMPHTASEKDFVNMIGEARLSERQMVSAYLGFSNSYDERNGELTIGQYDTLNYSGNENYIKNNAHSEVESVRAGFSHTYKFSKSLSNTSSLFGSGVNSNVSSAGGWTDKAPLNYGLRTSFNLNIKVGRVHLSGVAGMEAQRQLAQTAGFRMVTDSSDPAGYNIIGDMRSNVATLSQISSYFTDWTLRMPYDFRLTAGVGLSNMKLRLQDRIYDEGNNTTAGGNPTQYSAVHNDMVSPHLALSKIIKKSISVYASFSKGFKAPVSSYFFIPTTGEVNRNLKPEVGEQFELGSKGELLDGRIHYQLALFEASFFNKMTAVAVPLNSVTTAYSYMVNGGNQLNKGVEFLLKVEAIKRETGLVRGLYPWANFCYSDFKYGHFGFQKLDAAKTGIVEVDYSGKVAAGVPPITANAGLDFVLNGGIYGNLNYSYRDAMYFTSDNIYSTDSYSLLNAKLGIRRILDKHFEFDLFAGATNITGTQYYYMVFLNQLPDAYIPAPPEVNFFAGINLRYIF